jgi:hypothetical protein
VVDIKRVSTIIVDIPQIVKRFSEAKLLNEVKRFTEGKLLSKTNTMTFLLGNVKTKLVLETLTKIRFLNGNLLRIVDVRQ